MGFIFCAGVFVVSVGFSIIGCALRDGETSSFLPYGIGSAFIALGFSAIRFTL